MVKEKNYSATGATVAAWAASLVALYVLSIGPMYGLHRRKLISLSVFRATYSPVLRVAELSGCHPALVAYAELFD